MRHWIIGNGYSLKETPLELLKHEITWGMNAIHLLPFRPTYYFCMDVNEADQHWQAMVRANLKSHAFLWEGWRDQFQGNITWVPRCKKHHFYAADNWKAAQQWHLNEGVCTAFGSMHVVMQLAVLQGATEIYLLGCDLFDGTPQDHFDQQYPAFVDQRLRNQIETHIHTVAKRSCPVPIYNATLGGKLEIHPRVDLRKVLEHGKKEEARTY